MGEPSGNNYSSEFASLYKNSTKKGIIEYNQQERRNILLKDQKEHRHDIVDKQRDFTKIFTEEIDDDNSELLEEMDYCGETEEKKPKKSHNNKFVLMRSEWFQDIPPDLEENWLIKFAPEGFRVLLIAKRNNTDLINAKGRVLSLKTHFPGGGLSQMNGLTVLDCIYHKRTKQIFVLDCLFWNTISVVHSETTFRFFWIKNQFNENRRLCDTSKAHKIHLLEFLPAEKSLIQEKVFEESPNNGASYNGVVFYHKELQYAFEQTPLLGWLYCYMLPEKLGIDVPEELFKKMPKDYQCLEKYLENLKNERMDLY